MRTVDTNYKRHEGRKSRIQRQMYSEQKSGDNSWNFTYLFFFYLSYVLFTAVGCGYVGGGGESGGGGRHGPEAWIL